MLSLRVGRVCVKLVGREAGCKCIVVDVVDENFVLVTGPKRVSGVRRRRCNIGHVEPTEEMIKISKGASDKEVVEALKAASKLDWMKEVVKPSF
ncbi:MAG: 50S ribosomal protein L14e [Thermoproteota archaeon]|nr:50S ribosomal protein L14e [Thermoproteota archaeon]